jgi:3-methyladenine DNA glycosylase AlkD
MCATRRESNLPVDAKLAATERAVRARLMRDASSTSKKNHEAYFKGAVCFIGVPRPAVKAAERDLKPLFSALSPDERVCAAMHLLRKEEMEFRQVGLGVLARAMQNLPDSFLHDIEQLFDDVVRDWATCDMLCGKVLRTLVLRSPKNAKAMLRWSRSKNLWRRRAAAVAFVNEAKKGEHDALVFEICTRLVRDEERFVQLGCGWVLRELSLASLRETVTFIEAHIGSVSREGLRYAIEKMPKREQLRLLALHDEARVHGAR